MDYLSLKDHVYDYLVDKINRNELKPNDRIRENTIAEEMGVSRTPIREALIELAGDGIIESEPRKGFRVCSLDLKKVQNLYEVIGMIDGYIARKMADQLGKSDFRKMEELIGRMQRAIDKGDVKSYYELQVAFHDVYIHSFDNPVMIEQYERVRNMFLRKWYVFESPQSMVQVLGEANRQHEQILALFQEKDGEALEKYLRDVHWGSQEALFDTMDQGEE